MDLWRSDEGQGGFPEGEEAVDGVPAGEASRAGPSIFGFSSLADSGFGLVGSGSASGACHRG